MTFPTITTRRALLRSTALFPVALALAGSLAACTSTAVGNDVAAAEIALTGAEQVALIYTGRPRCGGTVKLCSSQTVVDQIKKLDQQAYDAVQAARKNSGLITAAWIAIGSLQSATTAATVK